MPASLILYIVSSVSKDYNEGDDDHDISEKMGDCKHLDLTHHHERNENCAANNQEPPFVDQSSSFAWIASWCWCIYSGALDDSKRATDLLSNKEHIGCDEAELT